ASDHVGLAVAVEIARRHVDAAAEVRAECEEGAECLAGGAVKNADLRQPTRPGPSDDVGLAVAVDVARRNADTAAERLWKGEEVEQDGIGGAAESLDLRQGTHVQAGDDVWEAGVGTNDDIGLAVAIDVAGSHEDAAAEGRRPDQHTLEQL